MNSDKKTARRAGILYLILALTAPYGIIYVPSKIIVWRDAAATAKNIIAHEFLFRTAIVSDLFNQVIFLFLVMVLYQLFRQVSRSQARLMVALVLVSIPIVFMVNVFKIAALIVIKGGIWQSFESSQLHDLGEIFLRVGIYGIQVVQLFWGLWLVPFGILVYRSGFIPRILGVFLITNGLAYMIMCLTFLLFPGYTNLVSQLAMPFLLLGEIPIIFWLLIKGVKTPALAPAEAGARTPVIAPAERD
ncbi:MAG: DUF4386 domain-containing protein, partial [Calditrichia bacterium]